jgi:hypothetical protein
MAATIRILSLGALLISASACGRADSKSDERADASDSLPALSSSRSTPSAANAEKVDESTTKGELPWHALDKCGVVDALMQPDGDRLAKKSVKSLPFDAELAIGRLHLEAKLVAAMDVEFFTDRFVVTTTVDVYEASSEVMAIAAGGGEMGLPWVMTSVSWLPGYFEYDAIQKELGWDVAPCSVLPIVKREDTFGKTKTVTEFAPGFPGGLNASLGLEVVRGELGEGRTFPAVEASRTDIRPGRGAVESAFGLTLDVQGGEPTAEVLAALGLEGDASAYHAYELRKTASGRTAPVDASVSTAVFDAASGKSLGSVHVYMPRPFTKPLMIGFPAAAP